MDEEMRESLEESEPIEKKPKVELPEAPASTTVKIKSPNGFEWLFTMRDEKASTLMFKMQAMEENWLKKGFTPLAQGFGRKEAKPVEYTGGKCPLDGGRLLKPTAPNRPIKCENGRYDFATKRTIGCPYVEWPSTTPIEDQTQ